MLPHSDNGMIATRLLMVGFDDGKQKKKLTFVLHMQDEEFFGILTCFVEYCQSSVGTTVKCGFGVGLGRGRAWER